MCFWLGVSKIVEAAGSIKIMAKLLSPVYKIIMPEIPKEHPAIGSVTMNLAANMIGLDNAATPLGIKAMQDLQSLNKSKDTATNAQIMFLVINTSSISLFPISIFMYRTQLGAANPTEVFIPLLLATSFSTLVGFLVTAIVQKISLLRMPVLMLGTLFIALIASVIYWGISAGSSLATQSTLIGNSIIIFLLGILFCYALLKKVAIYEKFIEGAKDGFKTAIDILPYLIAMLFAIAIFRASGALDLLLNGIKWCCNLFFSDTRFVDALPVSLVKPLSGSGARGVMIDVINTFGVDSLQGRIAALMQGSTETTFYVIAVYFGAIGITRIRHAAICGLCADFASMIGAIVAGYYFFA